MNKLNEEGRLPQDPTPEEIEEWKVKLNEEARKRKEAEVGANLTGIANYCPRIHKYHRAKTSYED